MGLDGEAVARRGLDDRDVAQAEQPEVQGARDRRRRQREDVDGRLEALELLLLADAEALLLVDDEQAEVAEGDVLGEQAMGADDEVDRAVADSGDDLLLLRRR